MSPMGQAEAVIRESLSKICTRSTEVDYISRGTEKDSTPYVLTQLEDGPDKSSSECSGDVPDEVVLIENTSPSSNVRRVNASSRDIVFDCEGDAARNDNDMEHEAQVTCDFNGRGEQTTDDEDGVPIITDDEIIPSDSDRDNGSESRVDEARYGEGNTVGSEDPDKECGDSDCSSILAECPQKATRSVSRAESSRPPSEDIEQLLIVNQMIIRSRGMACVINPGEHVRGSQMTAFEGHEGQSKKESWAQYLSKLDEHFLDSRSDESAMRENERSRPEWGGPTRPYLGLSLLVRNNHDLETIFKDRYEPKFTRAQATNSFDQLRVCLGQYARFCVVYRVMPADQVYRKGSLFNAVCASRVLKLFLSNFQVRASASTVLSKATHLKVLATYAQSYFRQRNDEIRVNQAVSVIQYLRSVCAAEKMESRRGTARMQQEDARNELGTLLAGDDFQQISHRAREILYGLKARLTRSAEEHESGTPNVRQAALVSEMKTQPHLLSKWCIYFAGLIVITGSGQRPNAYIQLQVPSNFEAVYRSWSGERPSLATILEKTHRSSGFVRVIFPSWTKELIWFHVQIVRRAILDNLGIDADAHQACHALLINTRTGQQYRTEQLRSTFRCFISGIYPDLAHVTPRAVRSSFATWQFKLYSLGKKFQSYTTDQFLDALGKTMNTSAEMLKGVYIAYSEAEGSQPAVVRQLLQELDCETGQDN
jgi:hypothetical protein